MAKRLDQSVWGNLSEECLDRIVAFLPLPALSRFRVVSRKYNAWIYSQEFIKLCGQLPLRESRVWMACSGKIGGLIGTNFKVGAGANLFGSAHEGMLPYFGPEWEQYMRAASGDLLVVECTKPPAGETGPSLYEMFGDVSIMICDFSTMTCARLPEPAVLPERWYGYTFVMLGQCGEDNAGAYKVAIMDLTHYTDQANGKPYSFQVYSSVTQRWKELHPDATSEFKFGALINCIFLFEKIFCLLRVGPKEQCFHEILAFDTNTEKYEFKMIIPDSDLMTGKKQQKKKKKSDLLFPENHEKPASLKLVAANGRLHLTGWIGHREFLVFEVDLANKQLIKVAELPKSLRQGLTCVNVQVDGHKECIFLYPSKGDNIIYDFSRKTWRVLRNCVIRGLALSKFEFSIEEDE